LDKAIFLPVAALVALTFGVALLLLRARFRAAYRLSVNEYNGLQTVQVNLEHVENP